MTRTEIVAALGREKRVERMVCNIAHTRLSADLRDLCQIVYLILLTYDEDKIIDLWEHGEINFFLARVIVKQYRGNRTNYEAAIRRFRRRTTDIAGLEIPDER